MKPGPIVYGPSGEQVASLHVAMVPVEENKANADYIVQACNAHPALVEALEGCVTKPDAMAHKSHYYALRRLDSINEIVLAALVGKGVDRE